MVEQHPDYLSLEGKTSLITGGSRGIGKAIGLAFAQVGSQIYFISRGETAEKEAEALQTVAEIEALGVKAIWIQADLAKDQGIETILSKAEDDGAQIDVFVSNAGYPFDTLAEFTNAQLLDASYNLNLRAPVLIATQLKARGLLAQNARVIFNASIIGEVPNTGQVNYGIMKAGTIQAARILAEEWGPEGIGVNSMSPGFVRTELTANLPQGAIQMLEDMTPLNRLGNPEDVAGVALFLASNRLSAYVNGANIVVDGGLWGKAAAAVPLYSTGYRRLTHNQRRELGI